MNASKENADQIQNVSIYLEASSAAVCQDFNSPPQLSVLVSHSIYHQYKFVHLNT